ncbi:MAG TPA: hypothetical protein VFZ59_13005 [Verrucomicrobiae bacterium]|nr:hypothetical protein [Verrucomicrobiae bacterium]
MKLRKRQKVLLLIASLALGLGLVAIIHHIRAKRALATYQQQLIAAGEKLTVDEITPKPLPPDKNAATVFNRALNLMNPQVGVFITNPPASMTMVAPGKARIGWAEPSIRSREATNSWDDAIADVGELSPALTLLEELIERPHLDFGINYRLGFSTPLPNLAQSKRAAQYLCYAALCDLHQGNTKSATVRLRALLALSQASADERFIISQLVRIAIAAIGSAATWELLQSPAVTDEQLAQLQDDWTRLEFSLAAENSLAMERAIALMTAAQMRESSAEFRKMTAAFTWPPSPATTTSSNWFDKTEQFAKDTWNKSRLKAKETAWRFSWVYTDQLRSLQAVQALIACLRQARTNNSFGPALSSQEQKWEEIGLNRLETDDSSNAETPEVNLRTMFSQSISSLSRFVNKVLVIEANRQLVVTAIALQRYKLVAGDYPADLGALVPEFLPGLPKDPVDGNSLRYKRNSDGTFLLYSVGADGEDNGGDPNPAKPGSKSMHWQHCRDWVWPQPATQAELATFYDRHSFALPN